MLSLNRNESLAAALEEINQQNIRPDENLQPLYDKVFKTVVDIFIDKMKEQDEVFRELFMETYGTGSYFDGLKVGATEPEFDLNLVFGIDSLYIKLEMGSDGLKHDPKEPNFSFLKFVKSMPSQAETSICFERNGSSYLSPEKMFQMVSRAGDRALTKMGTKIVIDGDELRVTRSTKLPYTLKVDGLVGEAHVKCSIDLVPSIKLDISLLPVFSPISLRIEKIKKQFHCYTNTFMAISLPRVDAEKFELDFHDIERAILDGQGCASTVIMLLKHLRDSKGGALFKLNSHWLKTVVMHQVIYHIKDPGYWSHNNLPICFLDSLSALQRGLEKQSITDVFFDEFNMLKIIKQPQVITETHVWLTRMLGEYKRSEDIYSLFYHKKPYKNRLWYGLFDAFGKHFGTNFCGALGKLLILVISYMASFLLAKTNATPLSAPTSPVPDLRTKNIQLKHETDAVNVEAKNDKKEKEIFLANMFAEKKKVIESYKTGDALNGVSPKENKEMLKNKILPAFLEGLDRITINTKTMKKLEIIYRGELKRMLSLHQQTPSAAVYLTAGVLPVEAEIDLKILHLFGEQKIKISDLIVIARTTMKKYSVPSPDEFIKHRGTLEDWKMLCDETIKEKWYTKLRADIFEGPVMSNLSVSKLHPIWEYASLDPQEVTKATFNMLFLLDVYFTNKFLRKLKKSEIDHCHCSNVVEDISHIVLDCPSYSELRDAFILELTNLNHSFVQYCINNPDVMLAAVLDPESPKLPNNLKCGWKSKSRVYECTRNFLYSIHKQREQINMQKRGESSV